MDQLLASPVTMALLAANIIASVIAFNVTDFYEQNLFSIKAIRKDGQWHRFLTSAFLHVNPTHLFINMYVLWMFGMVLEGTLGSSGFLIVYFASLVGGNLWECVDKWNQPNYRAVGASGATSGMVLSYCIFYPFSMLYLFFAIPMWAIVFGVGFIVISYVLSKREGAMIAHGAHLGGALAGLVTTLLMHPDAWGRLMEQVSQRFG